MAKTQDQTISFLQRLEQTQKERDDEHKTRFGNIHTRTDEVKQRQGVLQRKRDKKRFFVEKKYQTQDSQVELAKERSKSTI